MELSGRLAAPGADAPEIHAGEQFGQAQRKRCGTGTTAIECGVIAAGISVATIAAIDTQVESWRKTDDGKTEFTMRRLRTAD